MALRLAPAPAAAPVADPSTRVAEVTAAIATTRAELHRALLDGTGTAPIRAKLDQLAVELTEARRAVAEAADRVAAEERAALRDAGDVLAQAAAARISAVLAPLAPPPAP